MNNVAFRAWLKDEKKMVRVINLNLWDKTIAYLENNIRKNKSFDDIELLPYTGLNDKNGKKIFTGDIVCTRYKSGEICSVGDIQFDCGVFGAEWEQNKKSRSMVGGWGQRHNLRKLDDDIIDDIEIIGNIHDNPELLEAKNGR